MVASVQDGFIALANLEVPWSEREMVRAKEMLIDQGFLMDPHRPSHPSIRRSVFHSLQDQGELPMGRSDPPAGPVVHDSHGWALP